MTSPKSTPEVSVLNDQQKVDGKKAIGHNKSVPKNTGITRNGRRSAFVAFGDRESLESRAHKRQVRASSLPAFENRNTITDTSVENEVQNALDNDPRDFHVNTFNRPLGGQIIPPALSTENDDVKAFDLVPSTRISAAKMVAVTTTSNIRGAEKVIGVEKMVPGSRNVEYDNLKSANPDDMGTYNCPSKPNDSRRDSIRYQIRDLWWVRILLLANTFVLAAMIFSGLLLNERTKYQLKSIECMNHLHWAHQVMDLTSEFESVGEPNDENSVSDRFEEHEFYWKDLEAQVRHWKKETKKYKQFGDGFKAQCEEDLQNILPRIDTEEEVNSLR